MTQTDLSLTRGLAIALVPLTAAAGPYLLPVPIGGVTLYAFRVLMILGIPAVILANAARFRADPRLTTLSLWCGGLWFVWGLASLAWAHDTPAAMADVIAVALGWVTIIVLAEGIGQSRAALRALRRGWIAGFVLALAVAGWELATRQHLTSSFTAQEPASVLSGLLPISTFGNPNNFAGFLLLAVPLLLWELLATRHAVVRVLASLAIAGAIGLAVLTGARISMLGFAAEAGVLVVTLGLQRRYYWRLFTGLIVLAGGVAVFLVRVPDAAAGVAGLWRVTSELEFSGSASIRVGLARSGFLMLNDSYGLGVGAGNFRDAILRGSTAGYTGGYTNPHNFGVEILSQYGVVVGVAFLAFLFVLGLGTLRTWRSASHAGDQETRVAMAILAMLFIGYVFAASENSAYINQPVNWTALGTMVAMLNVGWRRTGSAEPVAVTGDAMEATA